MPIIYDSKEKSFHLCNNEISYIFSIMRNGQLGHIHFGRRLADAKGASRLHVEGKRGFTCYATEGDTSFSLDLMRQEYPSYGTTDFREPAFQILQENGSRITDFVYKSHRIVDGKPRLKGLPATYSEKDGEVQTLEVLLHDEVINCDLLLFYTVFRDYRVITRSSRFINRGDKTLILTRAMSLSLDFADRNYDMHYLGGKWTRECHLKKRSLEAGIQSIGSSRGASSSILNPFFSLARKNTDEHMGEVWGFSLVYSGNFLGQVEVNQDDETRVSMGIQPFDFTWRLERGEDFQTPEAVLVYSNEGFNGMSQTYHRLYRTRLVRGEWRDRVRPILINNWEGTYFDYTEEKILEIAAEAASLGMELFVLDDGWFGTRNDNTSGLGDWYAQESKLPGGIKGLAEKIVGMGLLFGLWFEPEMVNRKSDLFETHPDWVIRVPDRPMSHGRNQFLLDFTRGEVVDHIYAMMADLLREAPVSYIKWDMNRFMTEAGSAALSPERQMETAHRYMLGVYSLYERLISDFPHILFESCASGGGRFDPGMLYHAPQTWTSDNSDAMERLKIQYGTSFVYPLSSMGSHVSASPNHQLGRATPLETRANVAYFGTFGYELDLTTMTDEEKRAVRKQISFFKEHRKLVATGDFYRLTSPFDGETNFVSWMVVSADRREALAGYYYVLARPDPRFDLLKPRGLDPELIYEISGMSESLRGDSLMELGLVIGKPSGDAQDGKTLHKGDFASGIFYIKSQ